MLPRPGVVHRTIAGPTRSETELTEDPTPGPLAGVRVLDLTQALAGPYCTMLLADLGADVVKVEPPTGDMTRFPGPFTGEDTEQAYGGYFASINRGKRSIVLDLKDDADRDTFLALAATADVVVENSRAGVMDRLGVGYEVLAEVNPRLVYAAVRGFGDPRTGESPYSAWPAYDVVAQAMGGLVSITGSADGTVMKCGPSVGDIFSGTLATVGLLAAVIEARTSGRGQFVDVAMYDAVLSLCEGAVYQHSYLGWIPGPTGNGHPLIAPFDVYPTADGHCALGSPSDVVFIDLCDLIGRPELAHDERFSTSIHRLLNRPELDVELRAWTEAHTTAEIVERLGGRVPVGPVNDMAAVYADPHVAAREMIVEVEQPDGSRPVSLAGQPIKMTRSHTGIRSRPPRLGEHTDEVLAEAGIVR
ncbi:MAG: CoA transferase [Acidimicrobiales bacterium]|nr:CoA transferase [Acidimicrobiales bacterium]